MKQCIKCKETKKLVDFHKDKQTLDGYCKYCKTCRVSRSKSYYNKNRSKIISKTRNRYEKIKHTENFIIKRRSRSRIKEKEDPKYALKRRLSNRLWYALRNKGWKKTCDFSKYIGCTYDELIFHLEKQFKDGMTWANRGEWHIDHIIPLDSAKNEEEMRKLSHYSNLQPLWASENIKKSNKIDFSAYSVRKIEHKDTHHFLLNIHYAKSIPSISYAYGLFRGTNLIGVCTFGVPFSNGIRKQFQGKKILELNRLVLIDNVKNEASFFVAKCMKELPHNTIILSFSDTKQNHLGIIYQALNFKYYGLTKKRKNMTIENSSLHPLTVADKVQKHNIDYYYTNRSQKHRYFYLVGSKSFKFEAWNLINSLYKELPYPKF